MSTFRAGIAATSGQKRLSELLTRLLEQTASAAPDLFHAMAHRIVRGRLVQFDQRG